MRTLGGFLAEPSPSQFRSHFGSSFGLSQLSTKALYYQISLCSEVERCSDFPKTHNRRADLSSPGPRTGKACPPLPGSPRQWEGRAVEARSRGRSRRRASSFCSWGVLQPLLYKLATKLEQWGSLPKGSAPIQTMCWGNLKRERSPSNLRSLPTISSEAAAAKFPLQHVTAHCFHELGD